MRAKMLILASLLVVVGNTDHLLYTGDGDRRSDR